LSSNKCVFLGTGTSQGVPVIGCDCEVCTSNNPHDNRLRSSVLLQLGETNIVIDTGPDFRTQMLRAKVKHLDAVLLTHHHNDHIIGLDDIRPFNFMQRKALQVYGRKEVLEDVKYRFDYIFAKSRYPGAPSIQAIEIDNVPFVIGGIRVIPINYLHGLLPVHGFRIKDFAYLTDIKTISAEELSKLSGLNHLVVSALHHEIHHSHFNLTEALNFISQVAPQKAYLTHCSHLMGLSDKLAESLPFNVSLAFDGLEIDF